MAAEAQGLEWNFNGVSGSEGGPLFTTHFLSHLKFLEHHDEDKEIVSSFNVNWIEGAEMRLPNGGSDEISSSSDTVPVVSNADFVPSVNNSENVDSRNVSGSVSAISVGNAVPSLSDVALSGDSTSSTSATVPIWDVLNHELTHPQSDPRKKTTQSQASRIRYRGLLFSPTEPSILAEKYIVLGLVDASTAYAIHKHTHQRFHIKLVTARAAMEVAAQQGLLDADVGVRACKEIIRSPCRQQSWLVFAPHFGDLHSYVRLRRRLREAETQRLFAQIAATVYKCHQAGLILRDLKLRKFVFTHSSREEVALESLEDSVLAGDCDMLHDKHGCPAYVAPEILTTPSYSGRHADMWGLGVILYTMLIGRYPFHNSDTSALFAKIRNGKYTLPDWVSSRARHLIMGLLRKQPSLRLTAEQVLSHPWLTRPPRDHSSKDMVDHVVPLTFPKTHKPLTRKSCP